MRKFVTKLLPVLAGMMLFSAIPVFAQINPEAKAVYDEMEAKSNTVSNMNMYAYMDMSMKMGQDSLSMAFATNALTKNIFSPNEMEMLSKNVFRIEDEELSFFTWYKDGYSYTDMMGQKVKTKTDVAEAMKASLALTSTMNTPSDLLTELSLHTEGEQRVLTYRMDDAKMNAYIQQILAQTGFDSMMPGLNINVKNINGSYTLTADNFYSTATIDMAIDVSYEGETITISMNGFIDILEYGDGIEFDLPSPDGYVDIEEMTAA